MWTTLKDQLTGRFPEAEARVLCYVLGPISGGLMLMLRQSGETWSIRFHAFHSVLMSGLWASSWGAMRLAEEIAPSWFLATSFRQLRFAMNIGFVVLWAALLLCAYTGWRCAAVPFVHEWAVRLARRTRESTARQVRGRLQAS